MTNTWKSLSVGILGLSSLAMLGFAAETATNMPPVTPAAVIQFLPSLKLSPDERTVLERYIGHATAFAVGLKSEKLRKRCADAPEMFAWIDFSSLSCLLDAYELTGDTRHLDTFRNSMSLYLELLTPGDDGFLGWWGKPIEGHPGAKEHPEVRVDELQMNFSAIAILSRWVELARRQPDYAKANTAVIDRYLTLIEDQLYPKWDKRGFFLDLGAEGGSYGGLDYPLNNKDNPGGPLSHEKSSIMVDALLKLHRVTGKAVYLRRAVQLGTRFKHCLSLKDGHYEWMSWEPGACDAKPGEDAWRIGWIAPDPKGGWYEAAVSIAMNLYQYGLVFDDTDLARFLVTQKTRCWNGDMNAPIYRTVAGVSHADSKWVEGRFLSLTLALYDPELSKLAFAGPHEAEHLAQSTNDWHGLVGVSGYVRAKYLLRPLMAAGPRPFARLGESFLADPENRAFCEKLRFSVIAPGHITPLKPSEMVR